MATHLIKTWPPFFEEVFTGNKLFEMRLNDRNYQKGDILHQQEYDPATDAYTGREVKANVTFVLYGGQFGVEANHCCMSIRPYWWKDETGKRIAI